MGIDPGSAATSTSARVLNEVKNQAEKKQGNIPGEMEGIIKIQEIILQV